MHNRFVLSEGTSAPGERALGRGRAAADSAPAAGRTDIHGSKFGPPSPTEVHAPGAAPESSGNPRAGTTGPCSVRSHLCLPRPGPERKAPLPSVWPLPPSPGWIACDCCPLGVLY